MVHRLQLYGMMFLVAFTPLAFGATETWSTALMVVTVWLLMLAHVGHAVKAGALTFHNADLHGLSLLFTVFVFVQIIPIPANLWTYEWLGFKRTTLSVDSYAGGLAAIKVLCYSMVFYLSSHIFAESEPHVPRATPTPTAPQERLYQLVHFILYFSFGLAVFGLIQHFAFDGRIYGIKELSMGGSPFGPFVNRNHFAGYMELVAPLAFSLTLYGTEWRDHRPLYGFITVILCAALVFSQSRMGIICLAVQLALLGFLLHRKRSSKQARLRIIGALLLLVVLVTGVVVWLGPRPVIVRLATLTSFQSDLWLPGRYEVWRGAFQIFKDFKVAGSGLGTFPIMYPIYKSRPTDAIYFEAHNDYLQILSETGLIGAGLLLLFAVLTLARALRLMRGEAYGAMRAIRGGAVVGCCGLLMHSLVDFNLQIPSNAFLFSMLAGFALLPKPSRPHEWREEDTYHPRGRRGSMPSSLVKGMFAWKLDNVCSASGLSPTRESQNNVRSIL
ncbi:MAG: O-antigen ligase family protein [Acidobacteria bacterium]|nr:O-antigen ligase family protein [Acidobacteriota bacterium]MBI3658203.1 O-antigen ligase family protein [Acidobacteriota bacterium]